MPTFPSPTLLQSVKITSWSPTLISQAHNLARQVRSKGAHRWIVEAELPDTLTRAEAAPIMAFMAALRGQYTAFDIALPVIGTTRGAGGGTPLVDGAAQTGRSVATKGWPIATAILKAGDFITFAGDYKVYMLTADVSSDGSGDATLAIEPALFSSPADEAAVTVTGVSWRVALNDDKAPLGLSPVLYDIQTLSMIEAPNG
jgi:hypothetical protein